MRLLAGKAVILALFSVSLAACNGGGTANNNQSVSNASEAQLAWTKKTEKQLLTAIEHAPENGLKPDLFLKGDLPSDDQQRFAVLTQAALKYAEALAHGYSDPTKVNAIYTIPRPNADVRQGLAQAIQNGNVDQWLASLPPQTDEYKALSQAHVHYVQLAGQNQFQPISVSSSGDAHLRTDIAFTLDPKASYHANIYWTPRANDMNDVMMCANLQPEG